MSELARTNMRDSNMELLRILCMLLILIHHFIVHVLYPDLALRDGVIDSYRIACLVINGFAYVGVNCFILISGYYGIKFKIRSLFNLYLICVFYGLLTTLMKWGGGAILRLDKSLLYQVFLPFTHSGWWFIKCYVALFLVSPILNKAAQNLNKKEFVCSLLLLTVLNIYFGYYWHQHNSDGYNLVQFIYVYFIGAYLRKHPIEQIDRRGAILMYLSCALLWSLLSILSVRWRIPHWVPFYYNNPFVLLAAIGLFIFMTKTELFSRSINILASSVLAAYLIQDVPKGLVYSMTGKFNTLMILPVESDAVRIILMVVFVLIGSVVVLGFSFIMDRFRLVLTRPVLWLYDRIVKGTRCL